MTTTHRNATALLALDLPYIRTNADELDNLLVAAFNAEAAEARALAENNEAELNEARDRRLAVLREIITATDGIRTRFQSINLIEREVAELEGLEQTQTMVEEVAVGGCSPVDKVSELEERAILQDNVIGNLHQDLAEAHAQIHEMKAANHRIGSERDILQREVERLQRKVEKLKAKQSK